MKRIDSRDSVDGKFIDQDSSNGTAGTIINAEFMNNVQEEIVNAATMWGDPLDGTRQDQLKEAILKNSYPGMLPVFDYEIVSSVYHTVTFKCTLTWRGRVWEDTISVTVNGEAHYRILCFDLDTGTFEQQHFTKTKLPLLMISAADGNNRTSYIANIYNCMTLFDSEYQPQEIGAWATSDISNKSLFAWVPAGGMKRDNTFIDTIFFCSERFVECDIDFRGIPLLYQKRQVYSTFQSQGSTIRNLKQPRNANQELKITQFSIEGTDNVIHLLDDTKIDFHDSDGNSQADNNTLYIPRDTEDDYYKTMVGDSANRYTIGEFYYDESDGSIDFFYFKLFIAGEQYDVDKINWQQAHQDIPNRASWEMSFGVDSEIGERCLLVRMEGIVTGSPYSYDYIVKWETGTIDIVSSLFSFEGIGEIVSNHLIRSLKVTRKLDTYTIKKMLVQGIS